MRVIPPLTITDAILNSSTCAEPASGEAAWSSGTTYALEARVINTTTHRTYESLQAGNLNHAVPNYAAGETANDWWLDVGPTKRWAMFDLLRNTGTTAASPLTVEIEPGERINSMALLALDADTIQIVEEVGGEEVYSRTIDLNTRVVTDWYSYFFEPFSTKPSVVVFDLPPYTTGVFTVTITKASGDVTCGALVIGNHVYLGRTQYGAQSDALNFSRVDRDDFGNSVLIQRRSVPKTNQRLLTPKSYVSRILTTRTALNAVPAVWAAIDDSDHAYYEPLLILGYYRQFTIDVAHPEDVVINLELEEV